MIQSCHLYCSLLITGSFASILFIIYALYKICYLKNVHKQERIMEIIRILHQKDIQKRQFNKENIEKSASRIHEVMLESLKKV